MLVGNSNTSAQVTVAPPMQPNVWNPAAAQPATAPAVGANPFPFLTPGSDYAAAAQPMLSIGANMGKAAIGHYLPFASALWHSLRYYFDVTNSYVLNKLQLVLFPFRHRHWYRQPANDAVHGRHDTASGVRFNFVVATSAAE